MCDTLELKVENCATITYDLDRVVVNIFQNPGPRTAITLALEPEFSQDFKLSLYDAYGKSLQSWSRHIPASHIEVIKIGEAIDSPGVCFLKILGRDGRQAFKRIVIPLGD